MTTDEAEALYDAVKVESDCGDHEMAHIAEDDLRSAVLEAIAAGSDNAAELASIAMRTTMLPFDRWYA